MVEQPRILIADDDAALRRLVDRMLRLGGHEQIRHASDGREAADAAARWDADVLLADWHMPLGGEGLFCALPARTAAIVMTGDRELPGLDGDRLVLAKPFSAGELLASVEQALENRGC